MQLIKPTYLIAELAGDIVPFVRGLRMKHNPERVDWPVDITIAGSSGIGTIEESQDQDAIIDNLGAIVSEHLFVEVGFERILMFPRTNTYYLAPIREDFDRMHQALALSAVRFSPCRFPYTPHCTLKSGGASDGDPEFGRVAFPKKAWIECFSLYQPEPHAGQRLHRF